MYKFLKTYLPALSISFTFIILFAAVNNILNGYTKEGFCVFTLQVTGYLIISMLIDHAVSIINFKKYIHHLIAETVILYPITLVSAWIGGWFRISLFNIVFYTSIYITVMILIHYYFYFMSKKQADKINEMLPKNKKE